MTTWHRYAAYALLRVALGIVFFFAGLGKLLGGLEGFRNGLREQFAGTMLPAELVSIFGHALPFLEMTLGTLLLLGLFTGLTLVGTGLLLLVLTLGTIVAQDFPGVANNVFYTAMAALLLWMEHANAYALDGLRRRPAVARPRDEPAVPSAPRPPSRGWSRPSRRPPAWSEPGGRG